MSMRLLALTDTATLRGIEDSHGRTYWSVHDFITFVCGKEAFGSEFQNTRNHYACVLFSRLVSEESEYREELLQMSRQFKISILGKPTQTMNIEGLLRLLVILGTKVIAKNREIAIVQFSSYTGGDISRVKKVSEACMIYAPMLLELSSTANLRVMMGMDGHQYYSVYDFIHFVCDKDPKSTYTHNLFSRLTEDDSEHQNEVCPNWANLKFPGSGQKAHPAATTLLNLTENAALRGMLVEAEGVEPGRRTSGGSASTTSLTLCVISITTGHMLTQHFCDSQKMALSIKNQYLQIVSTANSPVRAKETHPA